MMRHLIKLGLTIALLVALFQLLDVSLVGIVDRVTHIGFIALAALLPLIVVPWIAANRWRYILHLSGVGERTGVLWVLGWKALFFSLFLPGSQGVDVFRILFIERRHPGSRAVVGSTVFIERMIGFLQLGLFTLLALPFVYDGDRFQVVLVMVLAVNGALWVLVLAVFLVHWREPTWHASGMARHIGRVVRYLHRFHEAVRRFPYRRGLLLTVVWIAAYQLALIAVVHLLFMAFGHQVPFIQNLLLYPLIGMLTVVPITIGGFGVREGAFVFFYSLVGVPAEVSLGVSLMTYLLVIGVPALLGGVLLLFDGHSRKPLPPN